MKNVLLVIDIQKEYATKGRPFHINGIEQSLANAILVLDHARKNNWEIIHIKHLQDGNIFNVNHNESNYIEGFKPMDNEKEFIKRNFSCFSNPDFAIYCEQFKASKIHVIGYNSRMCVLSTIIEGYHRGHYFALVKDASNAKSDDERTEEVMHSTMVSVLSVFADILSTNDLINTKILD